MSDDIRDDQNRTEALAKAEEQAQRRAARKAHRIYWRTVQRFVKLMDAEDINSRRAWVNWLASKYLEDDGMTTTTTIDTTGGVYIPFTTSTPPSPRQP